MSIIKSIMDEIKNLKNDLKLLSNSQKAKLLASYFKTGKGEYAEGDKFIGVMVPNTRKIARKYSQLSLNEIVKLLKSEIHEERLCALLILVAQFKKSDLETQTKIFNLYLSNTKYINNWDLVDLSAPGIVGNYIFNNLEKSKILYTFAKSESLWERRIAILATFFYIKNDDFDLAIEIARILLNDKHDLIHKAVGWMLREIGKKNLSIEEEFLKRHYKIMPRTMLRYAVEKFPEDLRQKYLKNLV